MKASVALCADGATLIRDAGYCNLALARATSGSAISGHLGTGSTTNRSQVDVTYTGQPNGAPTPGSTV
jgi:hypothetical protein